MIVYFADRALNILGLAGDRIKRGYNIENDEKEISVETAVATFSFDIYYNDDNRAEVEQLTYAGNYILRYNEADKEYECYTIIDTKQSTENRSINVYAEDVGLDLINDVCLPFNYETASKENNVDHAENGKAPNKGYINESGAYVADNNYKATNHIALPSTLPQAYLFDVSKSVTDSRRYSVAFYNSSKTFIAGSGKYFYFSDTNQVSRVEVPSGAKYVRISFHKDCTSVYFMASSVKSYNIASYINTCVSNSGFEIGLNEMGNVKYPIEFNDTQTASERILQIAETFGAELSYSFTFNGLRIAHKYINIYKRRGMDNRVELRLGKDVKNIQINRSVAELATAVLAVGNTVDSNGNEKIFTLQGYNGTIEDGYYIDGNKLCSRKAYSKWSRFLSESGTRSGHIVKQYEYDCDSQKTLYEYAIKDLKAIEDASVEYEVELYSLPPSVSLGDTVYIVDDLGEIYISARVLLIRRSIVNDSITVNLGDFATKSSGLADNWSLLKQQFAAWSEKNRTRYIWVAYADDNVGTGISLDPTGKTWMGMAENRKTDEVDLSDPSIFNWIQLTAKDGVGVRSTTVSYATTTSPNIMPGTSDWGDTIPVVPKGEVLWTRVVTDYTDSSVPDTVSYSYSIQGRDGEQGYSITVRSIKYISWASPTTTPPSDDSLWSDSPVVVPQGNYLWTKTTFSDGSIAYGVARQGEDGQQGEPGTSPIIDVDKQDGTATITITDEEGTKTITIDDGEQGEPGISVVEHKDYYLIADTGDLDVLTSEQAHSYTIKDDSGVTILLEDPVDRDLESAIIKLSPIQEKTPSVNKSSGFAPGTETIDGITITYCTDDPNHIRITGTNSTTTNSTEVEFLTPFTNRYNNEMDYRLLFFVKGDAGYGRWSGNIKVKLYDENHNAIRTLQSVGAQVAEIPANTTVKYFSLTIPASNTNRNDSLYFKMCYRDSNSGNTYDRFTTLYSPFADTWNDKTITLYKHSDTTSLSEQITITLSGITDDIYAGEVDIKAGLVKPYIFVENYDPNTSEIELYEKTWVSEYDYVSDCDGTATPIAGDNFIVLNSINTSYEIQPVDVKISGRNDYISIGEEYSSSKPMTRNSIGSGDERYYTYSLNSDFSPVDLTSYSVGYLSVYRSDEFGNRRYYYATSIKLEENGSNEVIVYDIRRDNTPIYTIGSLILTEDSRVSGSIAELLSDMSITTNVNIEMKLFDSTIFNYSSLSISYWTGITVANSTEWSEEPLETNKFSNYLWWYYTEKLSNGYVYTSTPAVINSIDSRVIEVEETSRAQYLQTTDQISLISSKQDEMVITQEQLTGDVTETRELITSLQAELTIKDGQISALVSRIDALNDQLRWARAYLTEKGLNVQDSENVNTKTLVTGDGINITDPNDDTIVYLNVNRNNSTIHNTTITGYANIGGASFSRKQETEYDGTSSYGVAVYN